MALDVTGVRIVAADRDSRWDHFVERHPDGSVYHLAAWSTILSLAYRFKPCYMVLEGADGDLRGVMPLVQRRTPVRGAVLESLPFLLAAAGPLAVEDKARADLLNAACDLAEEQDRTLTVDSACGGLERNVPRLSQVPCHPTWIADLPADRDVSDWFGKGRRTSGEGSRELRTGA